MPRKCESQIDWFKTSIAVVVGLYCLHVPCASAQNNTSEATAPILTAQLPFFSETLTEQGIRPKALHFYWQAVQELHRGRAASAEQDADRAAAADQGFADAKALAATAALAQRQYERARTKAQEAIDRNGNDEKAWVILATAENYLGKYAEAIDALKNVREKHRTTWQVAYQWARAEAGENDAVQTLDWSNRAALTAPSDFAALHLLRASALLAAGSYSQSADELDSYLRLMGESAPEREELLHELDRIRGLAQKSVSPPQIAPGEYNALAN